MIFIFTFVAVTKGTYPFIARDFFVSTSFGSKLMTIRMMPSRKAFQRLPRTQTSLSRAQKRREGDTGRDGASPAVCTLPMVHCGSSPVARLYLAKNEAPEEEAVAKIFRRRSTSNNLNRTTSH